jgi:branched-chain amino acid transport system substrate-binding protein
LLGITFALLAAACETSAPAAPGPSSPSDPAPASISPAPTAAISVAFVRDLSKEGAPEATLPSLEAVQLAFLASALEADPVAVDVVTFDTQGDPTTLPEIAARISGDPTFVAAIVAPDLTDQVGLAGPLTSAGVPVLSLSSRGTIADAPAGTWLRLVSPVDAQARALVDAVGETRASRRGVCLVAAPPDGSTYARDVRRLLSRSEAVVEVDDPADLPAESCGVVVWTGGPVEGAAIARAIGDRVRLVGGPALRDPRFLELAGAAAEGATALCSCADVSTSLDLAAQRFIQDFQSQYGSAPGLFAVEAWDAAHLLVRVVRGNGPTRAGIVAGLASTTSEDGLGGSYAFAGGELADPESATRRFMVEGGRWTEVPAPA